MQVTGFSNAEEREVGKVDAVPFLLEDKLKELGESPVPSPTHTQHRPKHPNLVAPCLEQRLVTGPLPAVQLLTGRCLRPVFYPEQNVFGTVHLPQLT